MHFEGGVIYAEPGIPLDELACDPHEIKAFRAKSMFFGGRAGRDPRSGHRRAQRGRRSAPRRGGDGRMRLRSRLRYDTENRGGCRVFDTLEYRLRLGYVAVAGPRRAAVLVGAAAVAGLAAAACGTPSPDLFVVERDGTVPGAKLTLLVSDQTARCNDASRREPHERPDPRGARHPARAAARADRRRADPAGPAGADLPLLGPDRGGNAALSRHAAAPGGPAAAVALRAARGDRHVRAAR